MRMRRWNSENCLSYNTYYLKETTFFIMHYSGYKTYALMQIAIFQTILLFTYKYEFWFLWQEYEEWYLWHLEILGSSVKIIKMSFFNSFDEIIYRSLKIILTHTYKVLYVSFETYLTFYLIFLCKNVFFTFVILWYKIFFKIKT